MFRSEGTGLENANIHMVDAREVDALLSLPDSLSGRPIETASRVLSLN
jgi:hypothetical protein